MMKNFARFKNSTVLAVLWVILSLLILGGSTYAWFTFRSSTNVTPIAGTVGNGGSELLISNAPDGEFSVLTELKVEGNPDCLMPVSTADAKSWFTSKAQNKEGVSTRFTDVTEKIDEMSMFGSVYLKSEGGSCDLYLNDTNMSFSADPQFLACCRLELRLSSENVPESVFFFNFDSIVNGSAVKSKDTVSGSGVVISEIDSNGSAAFVEDPSKMFSAHGAIVNEENITPVGSALCTLPQDEIMQVSYRIYLEGCDDNCINEVQDQTIEFSLSFAGVGSGSKE